VQPAAIRDHPRIKSSILCGSWLRKNPRGLRSPGRPERCARIVKQPFLPPFDNPRYRRVGRSRSGPQGILHSPQYVPKPEQPTSRNRGTTNPPNRSQKVKPAYLGEILVEVIPCAYPFTLRANIRVAFSMGSSETRIR